MFRAIIRVYKRSVGELRSPDFADHKSYEFWLSVKFFEERDFFGVVSVPLDPQYLFRSSTPIFEFFGLSSELLYPQDLYSQILRAQY